MTISAGESLRTASVAFLSAALLGAVLTPAVRNLALRWGALDHALTARKIHGRPVPRLGGIAIVLAFYAPLAALLFARSDVGQLFYKHPEKAAGLFAGGLVIAALGIWDDLRGCTARTKFLVQFSVAAGMYALGFRIDHIASPFGAPVHLGWLSIPFTMLWIAGVINAMNLIDGLDGLAGGVALVAIACTFAIAVRRPEPLMVLFSATLAGSVVGFLFYNFNPASIFMGDTGSMFLGFVLATTAIQTNQKASTTVSIIVPIIALGVPIADTLLAMLRRAVRGAPMFSADRSHIHHRLLDSGLSHRQTVLVLHGASVILGGSALAISFATSTEATWFLLGISVAAFVALRRLGYLSLSGLQTVLVDRRRNVAIRREIRSVGDLLRVAIAVDDVWLAVQSGARTLGAAAVALHLPYDLQPVDELTSGFDEAGEGLFRARYGLLPERLGGATIEFGWTDGRRGVDRDTEIAIELLCDHITSSLERLAREAALDERAAVVNIRR